MGLAAGFRPRGARAASGAVSPSSARSRGGALAGSPGSRALPPSGAPSKPEAAARRRCSTRDHGRSVASSPEPSRTSTPNAERLTRSSGTRIVSCILASTCTAETNRIVTSTHHLQAQPCADTVAPCVTRNEAKPRCAANRGGPPQKRVLVGLGARHDDSGAREHRTHHEGELFAVDGTHEAPGLFQGRRCHVRRIGLPSRADSDHCTPGTSRGIPLRRFSAATIASRSASGISSSCILLAMRSMRRSRS